MDQTRGPKQLRRFSLAVGIPLALLGGASLWRGRGVGYILVVLGAVLLLTGLVAPRALAPVERVWTELARRISVAMTYVVLTLTFYLVITPFALVLRLIRRDLLASRPDPRLRSYWMPVEKDGPSTRPDKPY